MRCDPVIPFVRMIKILGLVSLWGLASVVSLAQLASTPDEVVTFKRDQIVDSRFENETARLLQQMHAQTLLRLGSDSALVHSFISRRMTLDKLKSLLKVSELNSQVTETFDESGHQRVTWKYKISPLKSSPLKSPIAFDWTFAPSGGQWRVLQIFVSRTRSQQTYVNTYEANLRWSSARLRVASKNVQVQSEWLYSVDGERVNLGFLIFKNQRADTFLKTQSCRTQGPRLRPQPGVGVAIIEVAGIDRWHPRLEAAWYGDSSQQPVDFDFEQSDTWVAPDLRFKMSQTSAELDTEPIGHATAVANRVLDANPVARISFFRVDARRLASGKDHWKNAVQAASRAGIRIINVSLASPAEVTFSGLFDAIKRHPEMLFVFAAGNEGQNLDTFKLYPAHWGTEPNVLVVGTASYPSVLARWDNGFPVAGTNYSTSKLVSGYTSGHNVPFRSTLCLSRTASGSSFSAPYVAGLAARLLSKYSVKSGAELKNILLRSAQSENYYGFDGSNFDAPYFQ